jgi:hypothetical protein
MLETAAVEDAQGRSHRLRLDATVFGAVEQWRRPLPQDLSALFRADCRVPDALRYWLRLRAGEAPQLELPAADTPGALAGSAFSDYRADVALAQARGARPILLVIESPHVDEYRARDGALQPIAPAQGTSPGGAGGGIGLYLHHVVARLGLRPGRYPLVIVNPLQYHCSLGHFTGRLLRPLRDHVWNAMWDVPALREDFVARCRRYDAEVIVNCCTASLKGRVTEVLRTLSESSGRAVPVHGAPHPAICWNVQKEKVAVTRLL